MKEILDAITDLAKKLDLVIANQAALKAEVDKLSLNVSAKYGDIQEDVKKLNTNVAEVRHNTVVIARRLENLKNPEVVTAAPANTQQALANASSLFKNPT